MSRLPLTRALYRAMLRAYPSGYRERFAGQMLETFACDHARVRARGPWPLIPFWIVTIAQALWFGAIERRTSKRCGVVHGLRERVLHCRSEAATETPPKLERQGVAIRAAA